MDGRDTGFRRHLRLFFYCIVGVLLIILLGLLVKLLFPFVLAWLLALLLQPAIEKLSVRTRLSRKGAAIILLLLTLLAGGGLIVWLGGRLVTELPELAESAGKAAERISHTVQTMTENMQKKLPFLRAFSEEAKSKLIGNLLSQSIGTLSQKLTAFAGSLLISLPGALFVTVIFFMAAYYFTTDFQRINGGIASLLPQQAVKKWGQLQQSLFSTTLSYLRAYWILLCITFGELLLAFLFLRVRYAITLALLIAFLDALPAIGVGTVLLPWSLSSFLMGDWKRGILLCAIWLAITLIRQLLEPKIVGAKLGLHPLMTIVLVWIGIRLLGVWGLLLSPIAAILLNGLVKKRSGRMQAMLNGEPQK